MESEEPTNREETPPGGPSTSKEAHTRPWKCPVSTCKYHQFGWLTEKDLERHTNDKHSESPAMFECLYTPCPYKSKRESNCKQHMEKVHDWTYVRTKATGKMAPENNASTAQPNISVPTTLGFVDFVPPSDSTPQISENIFAIHPTNEALFSNDIQLGNLDDFDLDLDLVTPSTALGSFELYPAYKSNSTFTPTDKNTNKLQTQTIAPKKADMHDFNLFAMPEQMAMHPVNPSSGKVSIRQHLDFHMSEASMVATEAAAAYRGLPIKWRKESSKKKSTTQLDDQALSSNVKEVEKNRAEITNNADLRLTEQDVHESAKLGETSHRSSDPEELIKTARRKEKGKGIMKEEDSKEALEHGVSDLGAKNANEEKSEFSARGELWPTGEGREHSLSDPDQRLQDDYRETFYRGNTKTPALGPQLPFPRTTASLNVSPLVPVDPRPSEAPQSAITSKAPDGPQRDKSPLIMHEVIVEEDEGFQEPTGNGDTKQDDN
ncbi:hypothetical protein G7Z17_g12946 [Cylindrodendrum hubeiense]|uniref:C2H2-type domain-containing protein n=1 Tax=Cylindrodendrum hubeiense TaxID=595255 RepID=A0A9P5GUI4_9HYPO|nr:hypothetical protein G7Z17_g12946 [Cylindrodendrum hubeiense]